MWRCEEEERGAGLKLGHYKDKDGGLKTRRYKVATVPVKERVEKGDGLK